MKKTIIIGAALIMTASLLAGCGSSGPKTYGKSDTKIAAKAGEEFVIQLDSNPTTGYEWGLTKALDTAVVKKVSSQYIPNKVAKGVVGSGGVEKWTFQGVAKGTTTIEMGYARPFEKGVPPTQTTTFDITID
jgi:inhibitor of cysteine peptidase